MQSILSIALKVSSVLLVLVLLSEVAVQQVSASSCDRKSNFKNNVCATPGGGGGKFAGGKLNFRYS
jgi:hypothetical protein